MPKVREVAKREAKYGESRLRLRLGSRSLVAVDPGDVHVGMAVFVEEEDGTPHCAWAEEYTPDDCADYVAGGLYRGEIGVLVVERFTLYADKALAQVGSQMETSELIGVLKYLVRVHNQYVLGDSKATIRSTGAGDPWRGEPVRMWIQGADIKKAIRAQMQARGIERDGVGVGTHHGDALEHGWFRILRGETP